MPWYVLYTKPKAEKKVAADLKKMNVEVYCPTITEVKQWSDRKKKVEVPLFKSYVFVNLEEKERPKVFDVPGAVRYLFWLKQPAIVKNEEIEVIKKWLEEGHTKQVEVQKLTPGDQIVIKSGAFKEKKAIVQEIGKNRLRLILPSLGYTVNVEIEDAL